MENITRIIRLSSLSSYIFWWIESKKLYLNFLKEKMDPYRFLAILGTYSLLENGGNKILPVIP